LYVVYTGIHPDGKEDPEELAATWIDEENVACDTFPSEDFTEKKTEARCSNIVF
jgi:hypothetical protein